MEYVFAVVIKGNGNTPEEAWNNAVNKLAQAPGKCPDHWMLDTEFHGDDDILDESDKEPSCGVH